MNKRIVSFVISILIFGGIFGIASTDVEASVNEQKKVYDSYLTMEDSSSGISSDSLTRGKHMMTGECSISKAGTKRIYAFGATTANHEVDYLSVIVYVDRYHEDTDDWGQIDWWMVEAENDYFLSTAKSLKVDRGYYYRVRASHIAGDYDAYPYDETASFTDGIYLP